MGNTSRLRRRNINDGGTMGTSSGTRYRYRGGDQPQSRREELGGNQCWVDYPSLERSGSLRIHGGREMKYVIKDVDKRADGYVHQEVDWYSTGSLEKATKFDSVLLAITNLRVHTQKYGCHYNYTIVGAEELPPQPQYKEVVL